MRLYVMRHGPAEDVSGTGRDADRALTATGRDRVRSVAALLLKEDEVPTRILTSSLVRAVETADVVQALLHAARKETTRVKQKELAPGGNAAALVRALHPDHIPPFLLQDGTTAETAKANLLRRRERFERMGKEQRDMMFGPAMVVGHEPDLSELVEQLVEQPMPVPMDKAMVVALEVGAEGPASLRFIVEPKAPAILHDHRSG